MLKKTYAFIDFEEAEGAQAAIKAMDGKTFVNGEELTVEQSGRLAQGKTGNYSPRRKTQEERSSKGRCLLQLPTPRSLGQRVQEQETQQVPPPSPPPTSLFVPPPPNPIAPTPAAEGTTPPAAAERTPAEAGGTNDKGQEANPTKGSIDATPSPTRPNLPAEETEDPGSHPPTDNSHTIHNFTKLSMF